MFDSVAAAHCPTEKKTNVRTYLDILQAARATECLQEATEGEENQLSQSYRGVTCHQFYRYNDKIKKLK